MALLIRNELSRRAVYRTSIVVIALSMSGCLVLDQMGWSFSGPSFSHRMHVEVEELECMDCHLGYTEKDAVGFPRLKACMLCHEDFDEDADPAYRADAFYEDGKYKLSSINALDTEVIFSHLQHVTDEEGCNDCHSDLVKGDDVEPWMAVDMQDCMDCHEQKGYSTECSTCHEEVRADLAPWTHAGGWDRMHGLEVRGGACPDRTVDRCSNCHTESTCETCHQLEAPANHNNYWRRRSHGLTAIMDRDNCNTCHGTDYCDSCHASAEPQSHNGLWGGSKSTHCYGCHLSDSQQGCSLCHLSGAPSHASAPPQPPGHNAASDCRSCHLIITHVDNGDNCNSCHF